MTYSQKQKLHKGQYGYMAIQRRNVILLTILFYAISFALFIIGYITTGSKKNLLTIVAVLGLLPSSKSAVRMIMFLKAPRFSREIAERIGAYVHAMSDSSTNHNDTSSSANPVDMVYELVLTAYEGTYPVTCIAVRDRSLCAYSEFDQCKAEAFEEHVKNMLTQNGYQNMTVKLMKDEKKFLQRIEQMKELEKNGKEEEILQLMCDISL